jgi:hypothetical protein
LKHDQQLAELHARVTAELATSHRLLALFPPTYGSPEWSALPGDHPDKVRAIVAAAEAWRHHCHAEEVAQRLRDELDAIDRAATARLKQLALDIHYAGIRRWHLIATGPTASEIHRRRYPWLHDPDYPPGHPGGPVPWLPQHTENDSAA